MILWDLVHTTVQGDNEDHQLARPTDFNHISHLLSLAEASRC